MMFSATMTSETRGLCKKFISDPHEIRVNEESKLTLHGLLQYYSKLTEKDKNRELNDLMRAVEFNHVVVFVKSVQTPLRDGADGPPQAPETESPRAREKEKHADTAAPHTQNNTKHSGVSLTQ